MLNQKFVMDPDVQKKTLENNKQTLIDFVRFKVGEGIEKESDFAAEVKDIVS